jgi:hypothetical protein
MKRLLAAAVLAAVALGVIGLAASGSVVAAPKALTVSDITYREGVCNKKGADCKQVPAGADPTAFGVTLVFSIPIKSNGKPLGHERGECVNMTKASQLYFCTYNLDLPGGTVSVQGSLPYTTAFSERIPVTGGTGAYLGAYGSLTLVKHTFPAQYQLHIVTP